MKIFERFGGVVLFAGVMCYFFAFFLLIVGPAVVTNANEPKVIDIYGNKVDVPPYTEAEKAGRQVYIEQVCWHCHSQFVRPVNEEDVRWGPVSQPGESVIDVPHLYSTRRIGPDLAREGWRRVDDWHLAHLWDPRTTVRDSVMPGFTWLFREYDDAAKINDLIAKLDSDGDGIVGKYDSKEYWPESGTEERDTIDKMLSPTSDLALDVGGVMAPTSKQKVDGSDMWGEGGDPATAPYFTEGHDAWNAKDTGDGLLSDYDSRPRGTDEAKHVVEYLQRLGIAIGPWRKPVVFGTPTRGDVLPMNGVTATFKQWQSDGSAWTEVDAEASIEDGQMPQRDALARRYGYHLSNADEAALKESANYAREYEALMAAWLEANPAWDARLEQGKALYDQHCASCHGAEGRGNGMAAPFLLTRARDFTKAKFRYRSAPVGSMPLDGDLFRSIFRGLPGSSMPTWKELPHEHIWLLVDYVKSLRESMKGDPGSEWDDKSKITPLPAIPKVRSQEAYEALVLRGKAVYVAMTCNSCHGTEGRGDGPGWNDTGRDNGGSIRPRDLQQRDERDIVALRFRAGIEPEDLYRTIFNGLDGVGMPVPAFADGWARSDALAALKARGAPKAEQDAAEAAARQKLNVPLKDQRMLDAGFVTAGTDEQGTYAEYLDMIKRTSIGRGNRWNVGDDWALIMYVRSLAYPDAEKEWQTWK